MFLVWKTNRCDVVHVYIWPKTRLRIAFEEGCRSTIIDEHCHCSLAVNLKATLKKLWFYLLRRKRQTLLHCIRLLLNWRTKKCNLKFINLVKLFSLQLSPNIVKGLHQIANSIGSRDYPTGLRHHTQIVSSSNFSEISAFMPGLKMLLQIASQLRIWKTL